HAAAAEEAPHGRHVQVQPAGDLGHGQFLLAVEAQDSVGLLGVGVDGGRYLGPTPRRGRKLPTDGALRSSRQATSTIDNFSLLYRRRIAFACSGLDLMGGRRMGASGASLSCCRPPEYTQEGRRERARGQSCRAAPELGPLVFEVPGVTAL